MDSCFTLRRMRLAVRLLIGATALALGVATAFASIADSSPPIASKVQPDPVGDAGSGPDISSLVATVSSSGVLSLSVTLASGIGNDQSVEFWIRTVDGGTLNIAQFDDGESMLSVWTGSAWQGVHYVPGSWTGSTFTTSDSLDDLRDAVHSPVEPVLDVHVDSYVHADAPETPVQADVAPDIGDLVVPTQATAPPSTAAGTTTSTETRPTAEGSSPTAAALWPSGYPYWDEKIVRLPDARIEWKRLVINRIPSGATVTFACTKGCSLTQRPKVMAGRAVGSRFVGVPLKRGAAFLVKVQQRDGAGVWWLTTIVAKPGGQETTSSEGCFQRGGPLVKLARC